MAPPQDTSAYQDNPYGNQDPYALYGQLTKENQADRGTSSLIRQGALNTGFNPEVQHAQLVQKNIARIMQENPAGEDEDPLDTQLRQASAISRGMMDIDPATALRANQQVIRLKQAQTQQNELQARTKDEAEQARARKIANDQARTVMVQEQNEVVNGVTLRTSKSVDSLDPNDPKYASNLADSVRNNPGAIPMSVEEYNRRLTGDATNRASATYYGALGRVNAQAQVSGKQPYEQMTEPQKDVIGFTQLLGKAQPQDLQDKGTRRISEYVASGDLQMSDLVDVPTQYAALKRATLTAAQREGTIKGLTDSLAGMGENVKRALARVQAAGASPTDIRAVNAAVNAFDRNFMIDDNTEKGQALRQLFTTENAFLYEHGRLLSGGGARTNVAAVNDAKKNMNTSDSPDVIRTAIDTIVKQELPVLQRANEKAIVALANPNAYPAIGRAMKTFGGSNLFGEREDRSSTAAVTPVNQGPDGPPAATAAPPAQPIGRATGYRSLWLKTPAMPTTGQ